MCTVAIAAVRMQPWGALEYESDGYVPTGKRKQGAFGVGFCRKKGSLGMGTKKLPFLV